MNKKMLKARDEGRKLIENISQDKISDFIFLHLRNMWTVDGLYFLGIEEKFGTEAATEIDKKVWEVMGKIEARRLREFLGLKNNDLPSLIDALLHSSWALDLENKKVVVEKEKAIIRTIACRVQNTRIKKGLSEFSCKNVRWGFLKSFAQEFSPNIDVRCNVCPPDNHPDNLWCEWEFRIKGR